MILSETDLMLIKIEKCVKSKIKIELQDHEIIRLAELAKIGQIVECKKLDALWPHLFPEESVNLLATEDLFHIIEGMKRTLSHTCSMVRVAENRKQIEDFLRAEYPDKERQDPVEFGPLAQEQTVREKGCVLPSLGCIP